MAFHFLAESFLAEAELGLPGALHRELLSWAVEDIANHYFWLKSILLWWEQVGLKLQLEHMSYQSKHFFLISTLFRILWGQVSWKALVTNASPLSVGQSPSFSATLGGSVSCSQSTSLGSSATPAPHAHILLFSHSKRGMSSLFPKLMSFHATMLFAQYFPFVPLITTTTSHALLLYLSFKAQPKCYFF